MLTPKDARGRRFELVTVTVRDQSGRVRMRDRLMKAFMLRVNYASFRSSQCGVFRSRGGRIPAAAELLPDSD